MVKSLLCLNTEVCQNASDALASAITLSHRLKLTHHDQQNPRNNFEKSSVVIVDVGGVGYEIGIPVGTQNYQIGEKCSCLHRSTSGKIPSRIS